MQQYIERNVAVKKLQMIYFETSRLYLGIIKKGQKVIKDALDLLENPTKADPEKIYAKKCDCEKISDDL